MYYFRYLDKYKGAGENVKLFLCLTNHHHEDLLEKWRFGSTHS